MTAGDLGLLVLLATLWGGSYLFVRVAVPSVGPAALVAAPVLIGALLLAAVALARGERPPVRRHACELIILGALNAALPYLLIAAAERHITASLAAILGATAPLWASCIAASQQPARRSRRHAVGQLLGMGGVAAMVGWSPLRLDAPTALAVGATLLAALSYAAAGAYAQRRLAGVSAHALALGQQLGALVWLAVPAVVWRPMAWPPVTAFAAIAALGVLCTGVAYLLYFRLLARIGAPATATVTYLIPATGALWGALVLDERLTVGMAFGSLVVLASLPLVGGLDGPRWRAWRSAHGERVA